MVSLNYSILTVAINDVQYKSCWAKVSFLQMRAKSREYKAGNEPIRSDMRTTAGSRIIQMLYACYNR